MTERWKAIPGYEGRYEVSDDGQVRSLRFRNRNVDRVRTEPRILKQVCRGNDRFCVDLGERQSFMVHHLVLMAFVGLRPEGAEGAHLDGNHRNNRLTNLAWVTHAINESHKRLHGTVCIGERNGFAKYTSAQILQIRALSAEGKSYREISHLMDIPRGTLPGIVRGRAWKHVLTGAGGTDGLAPASGQSSD